MSQPRTTEPTVPDVDNPPGPPPAKLESDDSKSIACYANFCRITGTTEEMIIDFGFTPQPTNPPLDPIDVTQRVVMNLYTAKRLLQVLQMAVQRHEAAFGVLETDVRKRIGRI